MNTADLEADFHAEQVAELRRLVGRAALGAYSEAVAQWLRLLHQIPKGWVRDGFIARGGAGRIRENARHCADSRLQAQLQTWDRWVPRLFRSNADAAGAFTRLYGPAPDVAEVTSISVVVKRRDASGRVTVSVRVGAEFGNSDGLGPDFSGGRLLPVFASVSERLPPELSNAGAYFAGAGPSGVIPVVSLADHLLAGCAP